MEDGPPIFPRDFTCPAVLWILLADFFFHLHGFHILWLAFPDHSISFRQCRPQSKTPMKFLPLVWPLSRSLATTYEISVDFSSSPYLDVSVQAVPLLYLLIQYRMHRQTLCGLLHSDICGSMLAYSSPQLFAVNHVFLRLPMPRHSPCALLRFTIRSWFIFAFSQLFVVSFTRLSEFLLLVVSSYLLVVSSFAFCFQLFFFQVAFFFSVPLRTDIKR